MTYSTVRWADIHQRAVGLTIYRDHHGRYYVTLSLWWWSIQVATAASPPGGDA